MATASREAVAPRALFFCCCCCARAHVHTHVIEPRFVLVLFFCVCGRVALFCAPWHTHRCSCPWQPASTLLLAVVLVVVKRAPLLGFVCERPPPPFESFESESTLVFFARRRSTHTRLPLHPRRRGHRIASASRTLDHTPSALVRARVVVVVVVVVCLRACVRALAGVVLFWRERRNTPCL